MIFNSIRWQLQAWHGLLLAVIVSAFGVTAYQLEFAHRLRRLDEELQKRSTLLTTALRPEPPKGGGPGPGWFDGRDLDGPPPGPRPGGARDGEPRPGRPPPDEMFGELEFRVPANLAGLFEATDTNDFFYAVWRNDGRLQVRSTNAPPELELPARAGADEWQSARTRGALREFIRFTPLQRCVLVGRRMDHDLAELRRLAGWLVAAGVGVLGLGLAGGWWLSTQAIRPIKDIGDTASKIATGDLSQRINLADTRNELGQLATVLNATFARLEAAFAQQKQFTADASHELRTPLAVMISEAQTMLARPRTEAEYRETIGEFLATAQQMRRLTESLLELARFDAGQESLQRERLDLANLARAGVEMVRPLASQRRLAIHCDFAPAETLGDTQRLNQVITNLLTNAIQHNEAGGEIRVTTGVENRRAQFVVTDTGPGIAAEDVPHLFERFYRADKARARAHGHTGLGLAICKAIVDAHGGHIEVQSKPGAGSTFTVRLPAG